MRLQGPWSPDLVAWLERNAHALRLRHLLHVPLLDDVGRARRAARPRPAGAAPDRARRTAACASRCSTRSSARPTRSRSRRPRRSTSSARASTSIRPAPSSASGSRSAPADPARFRAALRPRRQAVPAVRRPDRRGQGRARARRLLHRLQGPSSRPTISCSSWSATTLLADPRTRRHRRDRLRRLPDARRRARAARSRSRSRRSSRASR